MSNCQVGYNELIKKFEKYKECYCTNLSMWLYLLEKVAVLSYKASCDNDWDIFNKSQDLSNDVRDYIKAMYK